MQADTDPRLSEDPADGPAPRPLRPFFLVWAGQAVSLLGTQAAQFALIWWLTIRTGSATVPIYGSLSTLAAPIGLALAAPIAEWLGVRQWFVAGGLICVAMALAGLSVPSIKRIEEGSAA